MKVYVLCYCRALRRDGRVRGAIEVSPEILMFLSLGDPFGRRRFKVMSKLQMFTNNILWKKERKNKEVIPMFLPLGQAWASLDPRFKVMSKLHPQFFLNMKAKCDWKTSMVSEIYLSPYFPIFYFICPQKRLSFYGQLLRNGYSESLSK